MGAVDEGALPRRSIATFFDVSYGWMKKLLRQRRQRGHFEPLPHGGGQKPRLDPSQLEKLCQAVSERPDSTLQELAQKLKAPRRNAVKEFIP